MHLKMKTSMGGPGISLTFGDEVPFDEDFPFSANEVHRFCAADNAELIGDAAKIAAWLKANPYVEPVEPSIGGVAAEPAAAAAADAAPADAAAAPVATPAAAKPAAAKPAAAKKG